MNPSQLIPTGPLRCRIGWLISATGVALEAVAMMFQLYTLGLLACIPIAGGFAIHVAIEEWDKRRT
jgi:hypothetical protein